MRQGELRDFRMNLEYFLPMALAPRASFRKSIRPIIRETCFSAARFCSNSPAEFSGFCSGKLEPLSPRRAGRREFRKTASDLSTASKSTGATL